ncbi:MAG: hypothetical protein HN350_12415 [Phycisphaerales bacterium]|jgi:hypothetical protein|nr:hypothetical protein [Phycisphaerales bacterium]
MANLAKIRAIGFVVLVVLGGSLLAGCGGPTSVYTVNCGSDAAYVDAAGTTWLADQDKDDDISWGAIGGDVVLREEIEIPGTQAPNVYLNERYDMAGYVFTLKPGKYTVRLHFAETYDGIADSGERIFDVSINKKVVLKDFDVFKEAGGANKPVIKEFKGIEVTEKLAIEFEAIEQNPEINGIEILAE